mmetsp:Transcript_6109/g.11361  ORF Transcript_6109/g.11361 Transcript_6109/m.11361 type:complete len:158 (+) Transcript_6109:361-834(+)
MVCLIASTSSNTILAEKSIDSSPFSSLTSEVSSDSVSAGTLGGFWCRDAEWVFMLERKVLEKSNLKFQCVTKRTSASTTSIGNMNRGHGLVLRPGSFFTLIVKVQINGSRSKGQASGPRVARYRFAACFTHKQAAAGFAASERRCVQGGRRCEKGGA